MTHSNIKDIKTSSIQQRVGKGMTVQQLATELAVPYSTIYNNPSSFGGVKIGGRWWFFESLVEEALWSKYKESSYASLEEKQKREKGTLCKDKDRRETKCKEVQNMGRGPKVGIGTKGSAKRIREIDPYGLLNNSSVHHSTSDKH